MNTIKRNLVFMDLEFGIWILRFFQITNYQLQVTKIWAAISGYTLYLFKKLKVYISIQKIFEKSTFNLQLSTFNFLKRMPLLSGPLQQIKIKLISMFPNAVIQQFNQLNIIYLEINSEPEAPRL